MSFSVSGGPWYGIGKKVTQAKNSQEAIKLADLNWNVVSKKMYIDDDGIEEIPGYVANMRNDNKNVLGIVSHQYKIIQNNEAFTFTDNLISQDISYDSAGNILKGKKVWLSAKLPDITILNGKQVHNFLIFQNSHDGKGSIRISIVPVLRAYHNPLNLPLRGVNRSWSTIHSGDIEKKMEQAKKTINFSENYLSALVNETAELADSCITEQQREAFIEKLFPIDPEDGDRRISNIMDMREDFIRIVNRNKDYKNTKWELVNVTSVMVGNMQPKRESDTYYEHKFNGIINGNHLLDRAYKILLKK